VGKTFSNIGVIQNYLGQYPESLDSLEKSLAILQSEAGG
jgi:hypothetical protein